MKKTIAIIGNFFLVSAADASWSESRVDDKSEELTIEVPTRTTTPCKKNMPLP